MTTKAPERWLRVDGSVVSCTESVKVLNENWHEARDMLQEMFEDAVLSVAARRPSGRSSAV